MEPERQSLQIESIGTRAFWWSVLIFGRPVSTLGSSPWAGFVPDHALFRLAEFARRNCANDRGGRPVAASTSFVTTLRWGARPAARNAAVQGRALVPELPMMA